MKAIILTLAVAGFMSTAHAGVYKKGNDAKIHNMGEKPCHQKSSIGIGEKSNPRVANNTKNNRDSRSRRGIGETRSH